jgi:hypothetical protein
MIQRLHQALTRQVPEGDMEPLIFSQFGRFHTIDLATRYFTSRRDDPHGIPLPFDRSTDPNNILGGMTNNKYFHGEDNKVLFYMLRESNESTHR